MATALQLTAKALLATARLHPADAAGYTATFLTLWEYVKRYVIDARHGGWLSSGTDTTPQARRQPKASMWKDCSHEIEGLLDSLPMLDAL